MLVSHSGRLRRPCKPLTYVLVGSNPTTSSVSNGQPSRGDTVFTNDHNL